MHASFTRSQTLKWARLIDPLPLRYGAFGSNHIAQTNSYWSAIVDWKDAAKAMAQVNKVLRARLGFNTG
jgi:hypothetical protein